MELCKNEGGNYSGPTTISSIDAYRLDMADINGDGHVDVLVAGGEDDKVVYIPGNGDGPFGESVVVSSETNTVWGVSAADLDNDGDMDVVSASRDDDKFAWYKNLGSGNFGPQQILTILISPFDVATSDVDNDGDTDIVGVTIEGGDKVIWFENQGWPVFANNRLRHRRRPQSAHGRSEWRRSRRGARGNLSVIGCYYPTWRWSMGR